MRGETSLHKLARRRISRAGRGGNGQGKSKGGQRGGDVVIEVPVGTVVRELARWDPVGGGVVVESGVDGEEEVVEVETSGGARRGKWLMAPSALPSDYAMAEFPSLPRARRSSLAAMQVPGPVSLDLSEPMERPMLLAAGAVGGLGNPHFVTKAVPRPKFATRGEEGMKLELELELKLLADVGFVGLPNAGKSTLLRALSRSRARVGDWAFTTLQPNIGTVVLDDHHGRPKMEAFGSDGSRRTQFSIADIPGLIPDAHLDRGLGLGFLRHIERARVLAFVVDLSKGDVVQALKDLWKELNEFENLRDREMNEGSETRMVEWKALGGSVSSARAEDRAMASGDEDVMIKGSGSSVLPALHLPPTSTKPWFVVGTKADLESTQENFVQLQAYLESVSRGGLHPSGRKNGWKGQVVAVPVSAIRGEGVDQIAERIIALLGE